MDADRIEKITFDEADFSFVVTLNSNNFTAIEYEDIDFERFVQWDFTLKYEDYSVHPP